jgi:hypothetical protein
VLETTETPGFTEKGGYVLWNQRSHHCGEKRNRRWRMDPIKLDSHWRTWQLSGHRKTTEHIINPAMQTLPSSADLNSSEGRRNLGVYILKSPPSEIKWTLTELLGLALGAPGI